MSSTRLLFVHARSPLHPGTGQATGAVDLPIARDRATQFPLLPGSSLKGALRARAREVLPKEYTTLFGPETEHARDHAGSVALTDARLLLLPVRSVGGTFAWVTSPYLLSLMAQDAKLAGVDLPKVPHLSRATGAMLTKQSTLRVKIGAADKVVLEEFDLDPEQQAADELVKGLASLVFAKSDWTDMLPRRFCLVQDDVMSFLAQHSTEIVTRVSIDPDTGTAKDSQLWTEENLPAETVLVSLAEELPSGLRRPPRPGDYLNLIEDHLLNRPLHLGGKTTVGRGRCSLHFRPGSK